MEFFSQLFGRRPAAEHYLDFVTAQRMVLDYARFLEAAPPMPGRIGDAGRLPHPKEDLRKALLMCIGNSSDPLLEEHFKAGYMMLSAFQPGVGETDLGTDFAALDLSADMEDIAGQLQRDAVAKAPLELQVKHEMEKLQRDLDALELELAQSACLSA